MPNDFYTKPAASSRHTTARAASLNNVSDAVDAAFDKFPSEVSLQRGATVFAVDSGAANAYVVAMPKTWSALSDGASVRFRVGTGNTNTGAATINVDSLGARAIKRMDGTDVIAGDLTAGRTYELSYDLSNTYFRLLSYVSTDSASINTVAANIADVSTVATNVAAILLSMDGSVPAAGQTTLTGGFDSNAQDLGTITSGTVTPEVDGASETNFKKLTNNGAFTLAPPSTSSDTTIRIRVINAASAGAITWSGFDKVYNPDGYVTTNAKEYWFFIDHDAARDTLTIREIV